MHKNAFLFFLMFISYSLIGMEPQVPANQQPAAVSSELQSAVSAFIFRNFTSGGSAHLENVKSEGNLTFFNLKIACQGQTSYFPLVFDARTGQIADKDPKHLHIGR